MEVDVKGYVEAWLVKKSGERELIFKTENTIDATFLDVLTRSIYTTGGTGRRGVDLTSGEVVAKGTASYSATFIGASVTVSGSDIIVEVPASGSYVEINITASDTITNLELDFTQTYYDIVNSVWTTVYFKAATQTLATSRNVESGDKIEVYWKVTISTSNVNDVAGLKTYWTSGYLPKSMVMYLWNSGSSTATYMTVTETADLTNHKMTWDGTYTASASMVYNEIYGKLKYEDTSGVEQGSFTMLYINAGSVNLAANDQVNVTYSFQVS